MKIKVKEKDVQKVIIEYLKITKHFFWRNNTGAFKTERGRFMRFGDLGSPDIFIVKKGNIYGIEVKASDGKQSDNQIEWQKGFEKNGGIYILASSLEEFLEQYK